jgi:fluoride exporter
VETWLKVFVLSIGGTFGVNARYWQGVWMNRWTSPQFPWATVVINVTGSFAIGFLTVVLTRWLPHPNFRLMLITGFLGGYTTFSTFEHDALTLWERGERALMTTNLVGSVVIGLAAVWLGTALARSLVEPRGAPISALVGHGETRVAGHPIRVGTDGENRQPATPASPEALDHSRNSKFGIPDDDPS